MKNLTPAPGRAAASVRNVRISAVDAEAIRAWCSAAEQYRPDADAALDLPSMRRSASTLPRAVRSEVAAFRQRLGSAGALRFRGLPIPDSLPATPTSEESESGSGLETFLLTLGLAVGDLPAFNEFGPSAYGGRRLHQLYGVPAVTLAPIALHTEFVSCTAPPDVLFLLCLRGGAVPSASLLCDLGPVWARLNRRSQRLLSEPHFTLRSADEDADDIPVDPESCHPLATMWRGRLRFRFRTGDPTDVHLRITRGTTRRHADALAELAELMHEETERAWLESGDLLVIDNLHMMHGRDTPPAPRFDGTDRWLHRCYAREPA